MGGGGRGGLGLRWSDACINNLRLTFVRSAVLISKVFNRDIEVKERKLIFCGGAYRGAN